MNNAELLLKIKENWLDKYYSIQESFLNLNVSENRNFQKKFNWFYRVRRWLEWQKSFYELFEESKNNSFDFWYLLKKFYKQTWRIEASFISKMLATINSDLIIIDSFVLLNHKIKIPNDLDKETRIEKMIKIYSDLNFIYESYLKSWKYDLFLKDFKNTYPEYKISDTKILDFMFWQTR